MLLMVIVLASCSVATRTPVSLVMSDTEVKSNETYYGFVSTEEVLTKKEIMESLSEYKIKDSQ